MVEEMGMTNEQYKIHYSIKFLTKEQYCNYK